MAVIRSFMILRCLYRGLEFWLSAETTDLRPNSAIKAFIGLGSIPALFRLAVHVERRVDDRMRELRFFIVRERVIHFFAVPA